MSRLPFAEAERSGSVFDRFHKVAALAPDRAALQSDEVALSYYELNALASQTAAAILAFGNLNGFDAIRSSPVALLFDHDHRSIVALLAVLKAGGFYAALHPASPQAYLAAQLAQMDSELILTGSAHLPLAQALAAPACRILNLDEIGPAAAAASTATTTSAGDFMQISFTSGSTGQPKGVLWPHGSILALARDAGMAYQISTEDRCSVSRHASFSAAIADIFIALLNGATLALKDIAATPPWEFVCWAQAEALTILRAPAAYLRACLDSLDTLASDSPAPALPSVRLVMSGGAPLYRQDIERLWRHVPEDCLFHHSLALTEAGQVTSLVLNRQSALDFDRLPAGYTREGYDVILLDDAGQPAAAGEIGEIAIRSAHMAAGYWQMPELTAQKFLPDPEGGDRRIYLSGDLGRLHADGLLEHLGRKDFMVKMRGHRVELEAVESALRALPGVKEAVVAAHGLHEDDMRLIAYLTPDKAAAAYSAAPTTSHLRRALAQTLPDHMIPSVFVTLPALPLSANGKVDRKALPAPPTSRPDLETAYEPPTGELESMLASIWAAVLEIDRVGMHDHFLDLGGNSILAGKIGARINQALAANLSLAEILSHATVAAQAAAIAHLVTPEVRLLRSAQGRVLREVELLSGQSISVETLAAVLQELEGLSDMQAEQLITQP